MSGNLVQYQASQRNITCPSCRAILTVPAAGRYDCPSCGQWMDVSPPAPQPIASYAIPQMPTVVRPRKVRETSALGILLEVIGLLFCLSIFGIVIGIPLLIIGSRMSYGLRCGNCGNKIDSALVTICAACKCSVGRPMRGPLSPISILIWVLLVLFFVVPALVVWLGRWR